MRKSLTFIKQVLLTPSNINFLLFLEAADQVLGSDLIEKNIRPKDIKILTYMGYVTKNENSGGTSYKLTDRGRAITECMHKFLTVVYNNLPGENRKDE
jgi:DNA-binding MarR family transcriptional regulator